MRLLSTFAFALLAGCYMGEPMPQDLELRPTGLFTDPNPHGGVPKGALRQADNVVLRRDGILQPRPGFREGTSGGLNFISTPKVVIPFDDDLLVVSDSSDDKTEWATAGTEVVEEGAGTNPLDWDTGRDHVAGAQARGNLYITTQDVVRKIPNTNSRALVAGSERIVTFEFLSSLATGTPILLQQYGSRAYRATLQRTDVNGVVTTSPPSPGMVYEHSGASAVDITVDVALGADVAVDDVLQIWRTPEVVGSASANGVPGEEYFLVHEHTIVSADLTADTYSFDDRVPDTDTGAALYTNPSQEGILQANERPHVAKDVAYFRGSMFYANTRGPHRFFATAPELATQTGNATGVGTRSYTGTSVISTNTITALSSVVGLKVGQLVDWFGVFPADTRITVVGGSSVTVNNNALASAVGGSVSFLDSIRIKVGSLEDQYYPMGSDGLRGLMINMTQESSSSLGSLTSASEYVFVRPGSRAVADATGSVNFIRNEFTVEELARAGNSFEVWATHGDEYDPALPEPTVGSGSASSADIRPNGIQWSKTDQPEHVPEANFATVGTEAEILRIIPTKDALFIFKMDGIWRLTGFGATNGWRIDPVDRSTFLLAPRAAVVMSGKIYAWTNRGIVRVNDYGVEEADIISKLAIGTDLAEIERSLSQYSADTGGAWLCANEKDDELLVGVPAASGDTSSDHVLVFNTKTGSWVKWLLTYAHAVTRPDDGLLWAANVDNSTLDKERRGETANTVDYQYSVTISGVSSTQITINGGSGWTPAVGDLLIQGTDLARVTSIDSSTVFDVDMTGIDTGSATGYVSYESVVEFVAKTASNPAARKNFQSAQVIWEDLINVREFTLEFTSSVDATPDNETRTMTRSLTSTQPRAEYFLVPIDHAMVSQIWPKIKIRQGGSEWELAGLGLVFDVLAPLVEFSEGATNLVSQWEPA